MKKIGKQLFHPVISWVPVAFCFALALIGGAVFALFALVSLIIRYPIRWPKKLREMKEEWNGRVD